MNFLYFVIVLCFSLTSWSYSDKFKNLILELSEKSVALPAITEADLDVLVSNAFNPENPDDLNVIEQITTTLRQKNYVLQKNDVYETVFSCDICQSIARVLESSKRGGEVILQNVTFSEISEDDLETIVLRYFGSPWGDLNINAVRDLAKEFQEFGVALRTSDEHWLTVGTLEIFSSAHKVAQRYPKRG